MYLAVVTPTHDPRYLPELWACLEKQTLEHRWEWLIAPTFDAFEAVQAMPFARSPRVRVAPYPGLTDNVGAAKLWAFSRAAEFSKGEVLVELDHDDLLEPAALELVHDAFERDPDLGFAYSDCVDWSPTGAPVTYHDPVRAAAWREEGWRFGRVDGEVFDDPSRPLGQRHDYPLSWEPSAKAFCEILYAPNHLRAWRAGTYRDLRGHDPTRLVCDDLDLVQRTYLRAKCMRIMEPLYYYRVDGRNTWLARQDEIQAESRKLMSERLHALVAREMQLRGLPLLDLGGGIDPAPPPWVPVDELFPDDEGRIYDRRFDDDLREAIARRGRIRVDLSRHPWPFESSSVGAFRAFDLLEHLPDRLGTMREIYRCLAPGGWLLSRTPSAAGPGAYQDPTHSSLWVRESFDYYCRRELGRFLPRDAENPRFMVGWLDEDRASDLPYIRADLVSLKDDDGRLPGARRI